MKGGDLVAYIDFPPDIKGQKDRKKFWLSKEGLTLIAGWYGMNFKNMPELYWQFGYPMVAILSVLVTGGIVYYCKKHKYL